MSTHDPWPFGHDPAPPPRDGLPAVFARCFAGADGAAALAHLKALTLDRYLGPEAPDGALRHLEGQRALVAHVLGLVERGRAGPHDDRNKEIADE